MLATTVGLKLYTCEVVFMYGSIVIFHKCNTALAALQLYMYSRVYRYVETLKSKHFNHPL